MFLQLVVTEQPLGSTTPVVAPRQYITIQSMDFAPSQPSESFGMSDTLVKTPSNQFV